MHALTPPANWKGGSVPCLLPRRLHPSAWVLIVPRGRIEEKEVRTVRVAHFDCFSGISGDMTLAALIAAGGNTDGVSAASPSLPLPVTAEVGKGSQSGSAATHIPAATAATPSHRFLPDA